MEIIQNYPCPDGSQNNQHHAIVVFQGDESRAEIAVSVGGNCYGSDLFDSFISEALEKHATSDDGDYFRIPMKYPDGRICDFEGNERDFERMCVAVYITRIVPEED